MNISSIVINVDSDDASAVIESINTSELCEYHLHEGGKIVATIEGKDTEEELKKMSLVEKFPLVQSVHMIYSYCEDHIEELRDSLEMGDGNLEMLNNESIKAEDIAYNGDVNNKKLKSIIK
jgi:periplasmic nitrate reductase NapD